MDKDSKQGRLQNVAINFVPGSSDRDSKQHGIDKKVHKQLTILASEEYKKKLNELKKIGSYVAGILEGRSSMHVQDENKSYKISRYPSISVVFKQKNRRLANYLQSFTGIGTVSGKPTSSIVTWNMASIVDCFSIFYIVNEYIRGPQIEVVNRYAKFIQKYIGHVNTDSPLAYVAYFEAKPRNNSHILSNDWLAGRTDANCNIKSIVNKNKGIESVQFSYFLTQVGTYHKDNVEYSSYFPIMQSIAIALNTELLSIERISNGRSNPFQYQDISKPGYGVNVTTNDSLKILMDYFNDHPCKLSENSKWVELVNQSLMTCNTDKEIIAKVRDHNKNTYSRLWYLLPN